MKVKVPDDVKKWEERRKMSPYERERYTRDVIRRVLEMNPDGVTVSELEKVLPFGRKAIEKHLLALTTSNEAYAEVRGTTVIYYSNTAGIVKNTRKVVELGEHKYELSVVRNKRGEFVLVRQIERDDTAGGIVIPKSEFERFVEFLKLVMES